MTMQAMVDLLENKGFKATKKYNPVIKKYEFRISKDDKNLTMLFEYPAGDSPSTKDKKQRTFLEAMVYRFEKGFGDAESLYPKTMVAVMKAEGEQPWITVRDMIDILRNKGFSIATWEERNDEGKHETHFMISRKGRTLRRVLYEYNLGGIAEIQKHRRYFIDEIVEAFEYEEKREKELKPQILDYDIRDLYPSTMYATDVIYRIVKEKEKEMSNKINWKVKNITVDNRLGETPTLNAEIEGTVRGFGINDIMNISNEIRDRLNAPEKSEEEYVRYCASDVAITAALNSRFGPSTKLPKIKKVIFNNPATIVMWADETKTVVKAQNNEIFDPEKGLAMAITKKALGNEGNYFEVIKKHVTDYQDSVAVKKLTVDISVSEAFKNASKNLKKLADALAEKNREKKEHDAKWMAYQRLQNALHDRKATKADLIIAMEEACGYLGEVLE